MTRSRTFLCILLSIAFLVPTLAFGTVIVDDTWADGGRDDGADPLDTNWWTTTNSSAIEINTPDGPGVGLVSGSSGRGIRATFGQVTLNNVGDSITATYTFSTPATVRTGASSVSSAGFKVGLFDTLGLAGLEADLSASSTTPNPLYEDIPGYMKDMDVHDGTGGTMADINIRRRDVPEVGRLMATTGVYTDLSGSGTDVPAWFTANTTFTGVMSITKTAADGVDIFGSISGPTGLITSYTQGDSGSEVNFTYGMLAFHANSSNFGSTNSVDVADNGITFSRVTIEYIPEPSAATILIFSGALLGIFRRNR